MGRREILQSLILGSKDSRDSYRRFLLENLRMFGWDAVVTNLASWLHYNNIKDVEDALLDYLANDDMTHRAMKTKNSHIF